MSYDVSIGDHYFNATWNIGQLFRDHMPEGGIRSINGMTGRQAAAVLADAIEEIDRTVSRMWRQEELSNRAFREHYDSPNGWGSALGGIVFLARIMAACHANPRKKVYAR